MISSSSPGKVILFGEHAVVYGKPCLSSAISLRLRMKCEIGEKPKLKSEVEDSPYFWTALRKYHLKVISEVFSEIPPASGLGSSASFSVSLVSCLEKLSGKDPKEEEIAKKAFEVEYETQGRASPNDTSVSTHGRGILISNSKERGLLWEVEKGGIKWYIHHVEVPRIELAIIYTGVPSDTAGEVSKVRRRYEAEERVRRAIDEIGELVLLGYDSLTDNDLEGLGKIMRRNQKLLREIGVSNEEIDEIISFLDRHSYGAKITGAGGGGSIIAIPKNFDKIKEVLGRKYSVFLVKVGEEGVRFENSL